MAIRKVVAASLILSSALPCAPAVAKPHVHSIEASGICRAIRDNLQASEKQLGYLSAQTIAPSSIIEQAAANNAMSTTYAQIATYKADLASHGCRTYEPEISPDNYRDSALKCDIADLEAKLQHINTDPVAEMMDRAAEQAGRHASDKRGAKNNPCDRARWKR